MIPERSAENGNRRKWYRSTAARALLAAALSLSLFFSGLFLVVTKLHSLPADSLDHPADPFSDDQSEDQVLEPVKQIVRTAGLQQPTAGYLLMSCKDAIDPPYQGAIYLNFAVPAGVRADTYFRGIADAMVGHGWREGIPPARYTYGATLTRGDVSAIVYQDNDIPGLGVLRLYGQCRNMNDHRRDSTAWTDITDQLLRPR